MQQNIEKMQVKIKELKALALAFATIQPGEEQDFATTQKIMLDSDAKITECQKTLNQIKAIQIQTAAQVKLAAAMQTKDTAGKKVRTEKAAIAKKIKFIIAHVEKHLGKKVIRHHPTYQGTIQQLNKLYGSNGWIQLSFNEMPKPTKINIPCVVVGSSPLTSADVSTSGHFVGDHYIVMEEAKGADEKWQNDSIVRDALFWNAYYPF